MVPRRTAGVSLSLLLLVTALAGCADKAEPLEGDDDAALDDINVEATPQTGVIRGVVVDSAIRPVPDATVTVPLPSGSPLSTKTNANGAFGFDGLSPGSYFVKVSKQGYQDAQSQADVKAGVSNPEAVKIRLDINPSAVPYVQELVFAGFIECSFSLLAVGFAACSGVGNDNFLQEFQLDSLPMHLQSEMVWESTQAAGDRMGMVHSAPGEGALLDNYVDVEGLSPLVGMANQTTLEFYKVGQGAPLMMRVFNAPIEQTDVGTYFGDPRDGDNCIERPGLGGCTTGLGATIQQEFTIFSHAFYNAVPPEGWRFTDSGVPQV